MQLRERKKRETRQALYLAARDLFAAQGFSATTLSQIAETADVSVPTLRNYFGDKDGFLAHQLRHEIRKQFEDKGGLMAQLFQRAAVDGWAAPAHAAAVALEVLASTHAESRDLIANHMRVVVSRTDGIKLLESLTVAIRDGIDIGRGKGAVRTDVPAGSLARMLAAMIPGALINWVQTPGLPPRASTMVVLAMVRDLVAHSPDQASTAESVREFADEIDALEPPPADPRTPRKAGTLRSRIYEGARHRFVEQGVKATRISDLATDLSVSPLTVHYHYGTKEGLIAELLLEVADAATELTDRLLAGRADPVARRAAALERLSDVADTDRELVAALLCASYGHPAGMQATRMLFECMVRWVEEGQSAGSVRSDYSARVLARIAFDLVQGLLIHWIQEPGRPLDEAANEALDAVALLTEPR